MPDLLIPSGGPSFPARGRTRLVAVLQARDEMGYLPAWFANVAPHVDAVVALDDGSTDGTAELLAGRPEVVELLRVPPDRPRWDEPGNHRRLAAAAAPHGDWILSVDADERLERDFRERAERVIRRGALLGLSAFSVRLYELWGSPQTYRADGIWARRTRARLFGAGPATRAFDDAELHGERVPREARRPFGSLPLADLRIYHLRMIRPADRHARRERYERLDPEARWQPDHGYAYLTEETGLRLRRVPDARSFVQ